MIEVPGVTAEASGDDDPSHVNLRHKPSFTRPIFPLRSSSGGQVFQILHNSTLQGGRVSLA